MSAILIVSTANDAPSTRVLTELKGMPPVPSNPIRILTTQRDGVAIRGLMKKLPTLKSIPAIVIGPNVYTGADAVIALLKARPRAARPACSGGSCTRAAREMPSDDDQEDSDSMTGQEVPIEKDEMSTRVDEYMKRYKAREDTRAKEVPRRSATTADDATWAAAARQVFNVGKETYTPDAEDVMHDQLTSTLKSGK